VEWIDINQKDCVAWKSQQNETDHMDQSNQVREWDQQKVNSCSCKTTKTLPRKEKHRTYYLHYLQEQRVHLATTAAPRIADKHTTHISAVLKTGHTV